MTNRNTPSNPLVWDGLWAEVEHQIQEIDWYASRKIDLARTAPKGDAWSVLLADDLRELREAIDAARKAEMRPVETSLPAPERAWVEPRGVGFALIACFLKAEDAQLVRNHLAIPAVEPTRELTVLDFGYAPGNYTFKCHDCGQEAVGDKRALRCKTCAAQALRENRRGAVKASGEQS